MTTPLRIVFAGTPEFAATNLATLIDSRHEVVAVYTQPDRPAGRGRKLTASPVKALAIQHDIPVYQPLSLKSEEEQSILAALNADIMVVVAYGLLLPKQILDTPKMGCINVHASILPRWRGAAPIHRSLLAGDEETGVTIMQMDVGLDTGDMLFKSYCPILMDDTSGTLHDRLATIGASALLSTLNGLQAGSITPEVQDSSLACYAHKLEKQEGNIDWSLAAQQVDRQIRGLNPWPVAFTTLGDLTLRVHNSILDQNTVVPDSALPGEILSADKHGIIVACGNQQAVKVTQLQLPGGKALSAAEILNSRKELFSTGLRFAQS